MGNHYDRMIAIRREASDISSAAALLSWDQETLMPKKGAPARGRQLATLSGLAHTRFTSPEMGEAIRGAEGEGPVGPALVNLREIRRSYQRLIRVPVELVREMAETEAEAKERWREARANNDFPRFSPLLHRSIELRKRYAEAVGYEHEPYDALLDEYEPGMTAARVSQIFDDLRAQLLPVVARIRASRTPPRTDFLSRHYPRADQERLSRRVLSLMHFDFEAGRMDISSHPFTTSFTPNDVRLTTRYDESYFPTAFFGTMHEGGHALYDQGLPVEHEGTPLGEPVSLGIHESQSRLWENLVGRSRPFWKHFFPAVKQAFPEALADVGEEEFYRGVNVVKPSLIRIEADEVHYSLHIMLRFEIERDLFRGAISADDTPRIWRQRMKEYIGIEPPTDSDGVLQDIHWAMGIFGYFPTYALGNLYAAQFMNAAGRDLPDLEGRVARGDLSTLLEWLRRKIHARGMTWQAEDLVREVTGAPLDASHFVAYLEHKYGEIYES